MDTKSREQESRDGEERGVRDNQWEYRGVLDTTDIPAREGFSQRWVRVSDSTGDDQGNVHRRINQGWRPRQASTVKKTDYVPQINYQGADVIGIHGMILMERPTEQHNSEAAYRRRIADNQMQSVTTMLQDVHDPRSGLTRPEFEDSKSQVTTGRRASVADD